MDREEKRLAKIEFPNTWSPKCNNKVLDVGQIFLGVRLAVWKLSDLPQEVRRAVCDLHEYQLNHT
jgi:hypothetical protein